MKCSIKASVSSQIFPVYDHCTPEVKAEKGSFSPFTPILSGFIGVGCGAARTGAPFLVTEEEAAEQAALGEACVQVPVLGGTENRISQHTRVQLNQFTKLTYRPTTQQCHMPKWGAGVHRVSDSWSPPQAVPSCCVTKATLTSLSFGVLM